MKTMVEWFAVICNYRPFNLNCPTIAANDDSDDTESHDEEDDEEVVGNHTMETI